MYILNEIKSKIVKGTSKASDLPYLLHLGFVWILLLLLPMYFKGKYNKGRISRGIRRILTLEKKLDWIPRL